MKNKKVVLYITSAIIACVSMVAGFGVTIYLGINGYETPISIIPLFVGAFIAVVCAIIGVYCQEAYDKTREPKKDIIIAKKRREFLQEKFEVCSMDGVTREKIEQALLKDGFEKFFDCFIAEEIFFKGINYYAKCAQIRDDLWLEFEECMSSFETTARKSDGSYDACYALFLFCQYSDSSLIRFMQQKNKELFAEKAIDERIKSYSRYPLRGAKVVFLIDEMQNKMYYMPIEKSPSGVKNDYMACINRVINVLKNKI